MLRVGANASTTTARPTTTTARATTTTARATTTTLFDTGSVGINTWSITASPNPAQPGDRVVLTTTISCGRRMSTSTPPYYPSMYYMVNSSPWINGVYGGPSLSSDGRTATFSVTVTAPTRAGTYPMYAYGRDNPFGATCTGDSYNFAYSSRVSLVVSGDAVPNTTFAPSTTERATTTTTTTTTSTTIVPATTVSDNIQICVWQSSTRPGVPGRYLLRIVPRGDAAEYRGVFNLIPAPDDGCPSTLRLASATTSTTAAATTTTTVVPTTTSEASTSTSTTTTTRAATNTSISATSTTTPIYEPPIVSDTSPTTTLPRSPDTIPARPEVEPDPVFIASDGDVEAVIQVVDSNEVPSQLSVQGRLVLTVDKFVKVRGKGFDRAGFAEVWLFSTPRLLGRVPKDDSGNFVGRVRIPEDIEQGEHTIELRAVTKRAKVVTVSVPAIVLGSNDNSTDDTVATTLPTSTTTAAGIDATDDTTITSTAPAATSVAPIRLRPGATELMIPTETVIAVVKEILGDSSDASTASVRIRINTQPWQDFDIAGNSGIVLPVDPSAEALEIEVTPVGGQPIVRSISIATGNEETHWMWRWIIGLVIAASVVWIALRRRRRDDNDRRD